MTKCKKHPTYKVIRRPTAECVDCLNMWIDKLENKLADDTIREKEQCRHDQD